MKNPNLTDDRDVLIALNNAAVSLTKWNRLQDSLTKNPARLRSFAEGVIDQVRQAIVVTVAGKGGVAEKTIALSDPEIALALMLATLFSVFESDILPAESPLRTMFAGSLVKVRNKREGETDV